MRFRGVELKLIKTYLYNQKQYITLGDYSSKIRFNNCGVPQGSASGPLLYTLFMYTVLVCRACMLNVILLRLLKFLKHSSLSLR